MHDYYNKNDKQLFWNRNMIATFIEFYKENECLYNKKHPDYKNQVVKSNALKKILHKLKNFLPNLQLKDVQDKVKAIRKQFAAEVSLVDEAASMGNAYVPKLWCFNQLDFLRKYIDSSRKDCSDSNEEINNSDDAQSDSSDISYDLQLSKNQPEYRWEREDTKIFINLVKKFKILYDTQHKNYNNMKLRHKAYIMLTKEAQKIDPKLSIQTVRVKIRTLRCQYLAELRRLKKAKEDNETYTPRLWSFDLLKSLYENDLETKTDYVPSNETISRNELDESNHTNELDESNHTNEQCNNEIYEIEPIHQVIIENEIEYDEEMTNSHTIQNNQSVVDYECENTFDCISNDLEDYDYKENCDKNETNFVVEESIHLIQPEGEVKPASSKESLNNIEILKYEWLGDLVTSQLGLISPKFHDQLAADVRSLIQKYKERSKSNDDNPKQSNDTFSQDNKDLNQF